MKVWLDDVRDMPPEFDIHIRTAATAIKALKSGGVTLISLDHDLGDENAETGYDVAKYIEEAAYKKMLAPLEVEIHSANAAGRKNIERAIQRAMEFWKDW